MTQPRGTASSPLGYKKVGLRDGALTPTCRKGFLAWDGLLCPLADLPGLQAILLGLIARRGSFIGKTLLAALFAAGVAMVLFPGWCLREEGSLVLWALAAPGAELGCDKFLLGKMEMGALLGRDWPRKACGEKQGRLASRPWVGGKGGHEAPVTGLILS